MVFIVPVSSDEFPGRYPLIIPLLLHQPGQLLLHILTISYIADVKGLHGLIAAVHMDGAQSHYPLPQGFPQGQIQYPVQAHLIFMYVKDPCLNEQPVLCQAIYSECPWQPQPVPFPVTPNQIVTFHTASSSVLGIQLLLFIIVL